jgi:predicted amidohydrolase
MRVAAIQLCAELGNIEANLARSDRLVEEALGGGARIVILPEFFPSAVAFHPVMEGAALPLDGPAFQLLSRAAKRHHAHVGGSFICARDGERFNTFVLAAPDGTFVTHDKDTPTMWENCYYRGGADDGVAETELGTVGMAVCWEFIRHRTAARLRGRVDVLVGGTCWAGASRHKLFRALFPKWEEQNVAILSKAPARMARMIGAPVIHASQAGSFVGHVPYLPGLGYPARFLGETQIVDARGDVLARATADEGERVVVADLAMGRTEPSAAVGDSFWTEPLPTGMGVFWTMLNAHGERHYRRKQRERSASTPPRTADWSR